jgi:TatD DNase family protein
MFIDTHCHLTDEYDGGVDAVISRATTAGVGAMICATAEGIDIKPALKIAENNDNIFVTAGIHPDHSDLNPYDFLTDDVLNNPLVIGVGEIGLDYHFGTQTRNAQIELFEKQIEIADKHNLPIAIHTRDAEEDTSAILAAHKNAHGVMHCFTSSWDLARFALDRGFYFSASGILTFKNAESIRETFAKIPNDKIVIETDSPYCAPVPHRGKVCEPAFVIETAKVLAQIKNLQIDELEVILCENTKRLYPKCHVKL